MTGDPLADLVADVAACPTPADLVNPLRDLDPALDRPDAPAIRRANVLAYLAERPAPVAVLAGEAMGWRGGRFSGIAFTSERQLAQWGEPYAASSLREGGWTESSATIIHGVLEEAGLERRVVLWNSVPFHPHPPGRPLANRAPRRGEVELGRPFLARLVELLGPAQVIAVGRVAEGSLGDLATGRVRHPAQGGATECREGLRRLLA
ncbi:MAG: uracil-DNA glycosylase [Actinomycetota bacterium]